MTEEICSQGHVLDYGARTCSRCGGQAIGFTQSAPVVETPKEEVKEEEKVDEVGAVIPQPEEVVVKEKTKVVKKGKKK